MIYCKNCGFGPETSFYKRSRGGFRCKKCQGKSQIKWNVRNRKETRKSKISLHINLIKDFHYCNIGRHLKCKSEFNRDARNRNRILTICKECQRKYFLNNKTTIQAQKTRNRQQDKEKTNYLNREYYSKNRDKIRTPDKIEKISFNGVKNKYNLKKEEYQSLLEKQDFKCAICRIPEANLKRRLHVDHDHNCCPRNKKGCGKCIRGLLCHQCNVGIGCLRDNPQIMRAAADYLEIYIQKTKTPATSATL